MVADSKKVQTLINSMASAIKSGREAETIRDAFVIANPDITGTPIEGNITAINTWLDNFIGELNDPVAQAFIDAEVFSHRAKAL